MTDEKNTGGDEVQFPLNVKLLEGSAKIRAERELIRERIRKIEASKGQVSDVVYQKVKADYLEQLETNTNQLLEKKQDIDRELATLYEAKKKVAENVGTHREKVEEIKFRNNLGEYKKGEYQKLVDEASAKLGKFEKILAAIDSNIKQYETLFEGEEGTDDAPEIEEAPLNPPPPPAPEPDTDASSRVPEEDYDVGKGEDYFGPNTADVPLDAEEHTSKDIVAPPAEGARLTIVEGEGKGSEFVITAEEISIGRASSNFVVLKEAKVSRQHATIKKRGAEYLLEDLHSSNGVIVNNEKIKEHALADGDMIQIGDFIMKFSC